MGKKLLIAAGGTGGHVSAGIAVAQAWMNRGGEVYFVGGGTEVERMMYSGYKLYILKVKPLKGMNFLNTLISILSLPLTILRGLLLLLKLKPDVVLGIGGYVAGPICLSAWILRIPFGILEENSIAGFTNRILDRFASVVFTGFEDVIPPFRNKNVVYSGNPIRNEVMEAVRNRGRKSEKFTLIVIGGSQGARFLNDTVPEVVKQLKEEGVDLIVIHQTGIADFERVRKFYLENGISAHVFPFDVKLYEKFKEVDLAISRAGAMSITELSCAGVPLILIPYPYSADGHQNRNAEIVERIGGGVRILQSEADIQKLKDQLKSLIFNPEKRERMAEAVKRVSVPQASEIICQKLEELCSGN